MIVKAASLVKTGKADALGEELHGDVARVVRPARFGVQVIQELDGYDRVAATTGSFDPKRYQGAASFTVMHNHTGSHLDTFAHIYRENALFNNMPPPKPAGTEHGIGPDSLKSFNDMDIVAVGSDNGALEWGFPPDPKYQRKAFGYLALPIHTDFLWNRGAYIMEILNLDELAKDQAYEFLFVLGPLLLRGGIGVPINPIAIR